jgi:glycosyltransferase involved in cell wall biosynthesis
MGCGISRAGARTLTGDEAADENSLCPGASIGDRRELSGLRVCYFGRYDPSYSRNVILTKCLERAGAEIIRIRDDRPLPLRSPVLLGRALRARFDVVIVGFRAHSDILLARLLCRLRHVPLVFDPLTSRYEEKVIDRGLVSPRSGLARWYAFIDRAGCRAADRVLLETEHQIEYFVDQFDAPRARCRRVWLGADDEVMRPPATRSPGMWWPGGVFTVFFYGRFSPLHGVEHIIRAAALLERRRDPVQFVFVGAGQTYQMARDLAAHLGLSTVSFLPSVPYAQLPAMMTEADLCLGSFGTTARARRVIPNKVFDALAVGRPVVTADTPGSREVLVHAQHAWLCHPGDPEALAEGIAYLKGQPDLRQRLAVEGHRLFESRFSLDAMTRDLTEIIGELVGEAGAHSVPR